MKKVTVWLVLGLFATIAASVSGAQEPLEALRGPINEVVSVLQDPQYQKGDQVEAGREKIWSVIGSLFDFTEMAKRSLARNWRVFSPMERKKFSEVFARFLGNTYLDKIQKDYQNEEVVFGKQEMLNSTKASVKTTVMRDTVEIPVDYKMLNRGGGWRVYDVNIEGVSLVKNYRTQFGKILMRKSPADLIERLQKKVAEQKEQGEQE